MTAISVASVKLTNPKSLVVLAVDCATANRLKVSRHVLCDLVDQWVPIDVPEGDHHWRSRFLKTCLGGVIDGPFLFLDSDTLVRQSLAPVFDVSADIGAACNNSLPQRDQQEWIGDTRTAESMGWSFSPNAYLNSGVIYFSGSPAARNFAAQWHDRWLESSRTTRNHRDQPAFNYVLATAPVRTAVLEDTFNAQICYAPGAVTFDAAVWHFYLSSENPELTVFSDLLSHTKSTSFVNLMKRTRPVLSRRVPWTADSSTAHIQDTLWSAYRLGVRLRPSELALLLRSRCDWRNLLMAWCCACRLQNQACLSVLRTAPVLKRRLGLVWGRKNGM
jgi:hypothetical protein